MGSRQSTVDYLLDQMAEAGEISSRKMFGEFALYCAGKTVALVCDDQLFIKPTTGGRAFAGSFAEEGSPFPGAKAWLRISPDRWDHRAWLSHLVAVTAAELPFPKPKKPKSPRRPARP